MSRSTAGRLDANPLSISELLQFDVAYHAPQAAMNCLKPSLAHMMVISECIVTVAGGPAMIRAAAKNHSHVAVVVDPSDYDEFLEHLAGDVSSREAVQYRKRLAWKAFQHCATYDSTVAEWLWSQIGEAHFRHCTMTATTPTDIMC